MSRIVHLHSLRIRSLSNPHTDLPTGMQMFAHVIVDGTIVAQSMPVESEDTKEHADWEVVFDCEVPPHAPTFRIAVLRKTQHGIRLLGSIEVGQCHAVLSGEQRATSWLSLDKVNHDGPLLHLMAAFSISSSTPGLSGFDRNIVAGVQFGSVNNEMIRTHLDQIYDDTSTGMQLAPHEFWVMHERILLLSANITRAKFLNQLGSICLEQWEAFHLIDRLNEAVSAYGDAFRDSSGDAGFLADLGVALVQRGEELRDVNDITKGVAVMEDVVQLTPDGHPDRPHRLNNVGYSLLARFKCLGDLGDLNRSVLIREDAVRLTPDGDPHKPTWLNNLGNSLLTRFEHLGDLGDLDKSVLMRENAVDLTPDGDSDKPSRLNSLGNSLTDRFMRLGDLGDLKRSILVREDALHLTPDGDPNKSSLLNNLGSSLLIGFQRLGDLDSLKKSVLMGEAAVHLTLDGHHDKPSRLNNLGNSLLTRFDSLGDLDDLNKSILMLENAIHLTPDGHPDKPARLNNLGACLFSRFEHLGELDDLEKSLFMQENAVCLTPDGHPGKPSYMTNLGNSHLTRFTQLGDLGDLNKSISIQQNAVCLTPDGHPDKPLVLHNFGNSLFTRFQHLGDLGDLNKAVVMGEDAVHLTPDGHPRKRSRMSGLGNSLLSRFDRLGDLSDLTKSILMRENVVHLTPDGHPNKPLTLNNFGISLFTRFKHLGDLDDLNKSVVMYNDAVHLTLDAHPDKPSRFSNLGISLLARFDRLGDLDDLNKSILVLKDAIGLTPDGHPSKPSYLNNLARCLVRRFAHLGDHADLQQTILHASSAAQSTTGPPHIRFNSAAIWAQCATLEDCHFLEPYQVALDLLPELAWLGLSITDRHYHLLKAGQVIREAAAASVASGHLQRAVEWLEQGRSVIWGQLLNLRSPVETLKTHHPELANQLLFLSAQLEGSGTRASDSEIIRPGTQQSLQSIADRAHENAHNREQLLKQIRELEGFSRFLLPKTISELSQAACQGPVVILNPSDKRCDALILMPDLDGQVIHIPLDDFKPEEAKNMAQSFPHLVGQSGRLTGKREGYVDPEDQFELNLSKLWLGVVKPVLNGLAMTTPTTANFPRIWWCPTGPLAFLPIHAAGLYGKDDAFGSKLSDFVISSYAPSLASLIEGFRPPSESPNSLQLLAVAQPSAIGQTYIPGTQEEINHIQHLANGKLPVVRLDKDLATVDSVQQGMKDSRWVHFACHGVQDVLHPTESALLLAGSSRLTLSSIIQLALPHADLAFLSACHTATGDQDLQEESVHLAAGMLLAGYRGVIATMWTIMDNDAPQIARDVYEQLFKITPPNPTHAAEALHVAVQKLRHESGKKSFFHWVPFIHFGV